MSFAILIPARSGSKRIKNKNLRLFNKFPLIYWTIKAAKKSRIKDIYVSTDSKKIMQYGISQGVEVPFLRPAKFSTDNSMSIDLVLHTLENFRRFDWVLLLQPTFSNTLPEHNHLALPFQIKRLIL